MCPPAARSRSRQHRTSRAPRRCNHTSGKYGYTFFRNDLTLDIGARVADLFTGSLAEPVLLGEHPGQASALKMTFASFQRTSRTAAALAQAHALADDHGITEALLTEAADAPRHPRQPRLPAQRRRPGLALATADILHHWADTTTDQPTDLGSILRQLHLPPQ